MIRVGEPGTKELLTLEELEASSGVRTGRKHILSILVENKPGVLTRIAGLFARRGFNIDTLAVGPTDDERLSRITLTLDGAMHPIDQVTKQLHKLVNVIKIRDLEPEETIAREMALFKVSADGQSIFSTRRLQCFVTFETQEVGQTAPRCVSVIHDQNGGHRGRCDTLLRRA